MDSKSCQLYATILLLVYLPAAYALWCPEGCNCDNENLFVNCGNEGEMNEKSNSNTVRLFKGPTKIHKVCFNITFYYRYSKATKQTFDWSVRGRV